MGRMRWAVVWLVVLAVWPAGAADWSELTAVAADRAASDAAGRTMLDLDWQAVADDVLSYAGAADDWQPRVRVLDTDQPVVAALPNGCLYASRRVREVLGPNRESAAFLAASLGALALSTKAPYDARRPLQAAARFSDDQVYAADRAAMLWMVRAGVPPLAASRALEALLAAGIGQLAFVGGGGGPHLQRRRQEAQQAAAELIKAGTEFDFGVIDLVEQRYADALVRFETFLQLLPDNDAAWNNVGLCHYRLAIAELPAPEYLLADAIAQYDTSWIKRSIREPDPEHWAAAKAAYEKALGINPRRVEALSNCGNLFAVVRQFGVAKDFYSRALEVDRDFAPALNNLGAVMVYLADGPCPQAAVELFRRAAAQDAGLAEAQFNLGQACLERKEGDAKLPYDRYLALAPRGVKARQVAEYLRQQNVTPTQPDPATQVASAEHALRLWNRVRLELESTRPTLVALVETPPDQMRQVPGRDVEVVGWSRQGLVVELAAQQVSRVLCGRPAQHEATTAKGARVGQSRTDLLDMYGPPPAVSKQKPYDVWLYPGTGLGFFLVGGKVSTIFLFEVDRPA